MADTKQNIKERPILFSGEMVRAILDGRKTQTRRLVKPQPIFMVMNKFCPYGQPGDRLWVRETWYPFGDMIFYRASIPHDQKVECKWRSPIHMPRAASRLILEITDVRVERLNEISEGDAVAEGCKCFVYEQPYFNTGNDYSPGEFGPPTDHFVELWKSIHGPESWEQNPWVWVIEFNRL